MATLGTQSISTSYTQVLKTFGSNIVDGTLRAISSGDEAGVSALQICTTGAKSTGTFAVDGASTFGSHLTASTGTATIGTLFVSGQATFGTGFTASTGTATIGTLSASTATISTATISTATISTATIPLQLGPVTFGTNVTMSTGTATIGTESVGLSTIGTLSITGTATVGSAIRIGATGPTITKLSYATASFGSVAVAAHNAADTTNGTFLLTGAELGDIVIGSINSLGSTTGTTQIVTSFFPVASNVVRYVVNSKGSTAGTIPAGTIFATAMRFTT